MNECIREVIRKAIKGTISTYKATKLLEDMKVRGAFDDMDTPTTYQGYNYDTQEWIVE